MKPCKQCNGPVEPTREEWATPVCWACVAPSGVEGLLAEVTEERDALRARAEKAEAKYFKLLDEVSREPSELRAADETIATLLAELERLKGIEPVKGEPLYARIRAALAPREDEEKKP